MWTLDKSSGLCYSPWDWTTPTSEDRHYSADHPICQAKKKIKNPGLGLTSTDERAIVTNMNNDTETFNDLLIAALNAMIPLLGSVETLEQEMAVMQAFSALESLRD